MRTFTWWCTLEDFHCPWRVRKCHCNTVWVTTTGKAGHHSTAFPCTLRSGQELSFLPDLHHCLAEREDRSGCRCISAVLLSPSCPHQYCFFTSCYKKKTLMTQWKKSLWQGKSSTKPSCFSAWKLWPNCAYLEPHRWEAKQPSHAGMCLFVSVNELCFVLLWIPATCWCPRLGLPTVQWHGFYSELPSIPKDIIALLCAAEVLCGKLIWRRKRSQLIDRKCHLLIYFFSLLKMKMSIVCVLCWNRPFNTKPIIAED